MAVHEETSEPGGPGRVLEDPTGARRRRLRLLGRAVAVVAFAWLALVLLGGIGVGPAGYLPLGHALRASSGPPPLRSVPVPTPPSAADLAPALPEPAAPVRSAPAPPAHRAAHGRTRARAKAATGVHGRSAAAPGHVAKKKATTRGRSGSAPGRASRTTTALSTATNPAGHVVHRKRAHTK